MLGSPSPPLSPSLGGDAGGRPSVTEGTDGPGRAEQEGEGDADGKRKHARRGHAARAHTLPTRLLLCSY